MFFSILNSPQGARGGGLMQWLMALWPQHPLFTEIAGDILCPHLRRAEMGIEPHVSLQNKLGVPDM